MHDADARWFLRIFSANILVKLRVRSPTTTNHVEGCFQAVERFWIVLNVLGNGVFQHEVSISRFKIHFIQKVWKCMKDSRIFTSVGLKYFPIMHLLSEIWKWRIDLLCFSNFESLINLSLLVVLMQYTANGIMLKASWMVEHFLMMFCKLLFLSKKSFLY